MGKYDTIEILPGMVAELILPDGKYNYKVVAVDGETVTMHGIETEWEGTKTITEIRSMCNNNECWVAWPPNLRQENM